MRKLFDGKKAQTIEIEQIISISKLSLEAANNPKLRQGSQRSWWILSTW